MALHRFSRPWLRVAATAGILLLIVVIFRGFFAYGIAFVQRPFVAAGTWVYRTTHGWLSDENEWRQRVKDLETQRETLAFDRTELERLRDENAQLREQAQFTQARRFETVTANILARAVEPQFSTFLIDRGKTHGLTVGQPVMVGQGILVGKITGVSETTATVRTLTDPAVATAVTLTNRSRTLGLAQGLDGKLVRIQFIPSNEPFAVNDLVVTSGLESSVPSGLLVGLVNAVRHEQNEPFQEAIVEPLADPRRFQILTVILK